MSKIYTAYWDIAAILPNNDSSNYTNHLYLVRDEDGDLTTPHDQEIVRGQAQNNALFDILWNLLGTAGDLRVIPGTSITSSDGLLFDKDAPPDGIVDTDKNRDGSPDSYLDRHYTIVNLDAGQDADALWTQLVNYANNLNAVHFTYDLTDRNCVSVVASALSSVGIDIRFNSPNAVFVGADSLLDALGDQTFTAFSGGGLYTFYDANGTDTINVQSGARLALVTDAAPSSGNTVVMQDVANISSLSLFRPFLSDDLLVRDASVIFNTDIVFVDGQFGSGGRGVDILELRADADAVIKRINFANEAFAADIAVSQNFRVANIFTGFAGEPAISGGIGNDLVYGMNGQNDILAGGRGEDTLKGGTGDDTYGWKFGDNNDTITDIGGNDTLRLGPGITSGMVSSGPGIVRIIAAAPGGATLSVSGIENITGIAQEASDFGFPGVVYGNGGENQFFFNQPIMDGGTGNDSIIASNAAFAVDALGGSGNDSIQVTGGPGGNHIFGGDDGDAINVGNSDNNIVNGDGGSDRIALVGDSSTIDGGANGDSIIFSGNGSTARGGTGDDLIQANFSDNNTIEGGAGNDTIKFGGNGNTIDGGGGNDIINANSGTGNIIGGGDGSDIISVFSSGSPSLGSLINGGDGNDFIYLGSNRNTVRVSGGDDIVYHDFTATTVIDFGGLSLSDLNMGFILNSSDLYIRMPDGSSITLSGYGDAPASWLGIFGGGAAQPLPSIATALFVGGSSDDAFFADINANVIESGGGNDRIFAGGGNDIVSGQSGNDILYGQSGLDILNGGSGEDTLSGGTDADELFGGSENDVASGGEDDDILLGDDGNDILSGDGGHDLIFGGAASDDLSGGNGNDTIYGDFPPDIMGDAALIAQLLAAQSGNDIIEGGAGSDTLTGGAGADTFVYRTDSMDGTVDTITDFGIADGDRLDLSALLEGYNPAQDAINLFVSVTSSGGDTTIAVDRNGGAHFASVATLTGVVLTDPVEDLIAAGKIVAA